MAYKIVMPQAGITTTEGTIVRWLKQEGERVERGEPLFEVTTDKVNMEVESTASGVLLKILAPEGSTVRITQIVAIVGEPGEDISALLQEAAAERGESLEAVSEPDLQGSREEAPADVPQIASEATSLPGRIRISPLARRIAEVQGVALSDLAGVTGTGPGGSIIKRDVLKYLEGRAVPKAETGPAPEAEMQASGFQEAVPVASPQVIPLTGMRRTIAQRMTQSSHDAPQFCLGVDAEASELIRWRKLLNEKLKGQGEDITLTYTDFLVKACALALRDCPYVNASFTAEGIELKTAINVGVATALEDGLIVPVIKNADQKSLAQIAQDRASLVEKARAGRLAADDVRGGTFTVSNLGMFAIDEFTAIINPPEAAILAVGRIRERLSRVGEEIQVVPYLSLRLTLDHRVVDGAQGARFLEKIKQRIEDPYLLLL
ncbi:MAG: 2-oxo acid dehydrogenase subunit E2 [Clostridia bacterium]|nr:2-oxo acid dehydrogenase subunit E2 [Clostridia bacterium]